MSASPIAALIVNRALCRDCIAEKSGMEARAVDAAITGLSLASKVDHYLNGTCVACRKSALVYAIDRPPKR